MDENGTMEYSGILNMDGTSVWRPAEAQDLAEVAAHALVRAEVEQADGAAPRDGTWWVE
jgi:hypothetical protein